MRDVDLDVDEDVDVDLNVEVDLDAGADADVDVDGRSALWTSEEGTDGRRRRATAALTAHADAPATQAGLFASSPDGKETATPPARTGARAATRRRFTRNGETTGARRETDADQRRRARQTGRAGGRAGVGAWQRRGINPAREACKRANA